MSAARQGNVAVRLSQRFKVSHLCVFSTFIFFLKAVIQCLTIVINRHRELTVSLWLHMSLLAAAAFCLLTTYLQNIFLTCKLYLVYFIS